ncbi:MAG TPA: AI-2E family transporter [Candidatus Dormibacteraeota bacterium]|nr:AI-2E family transporter [Candidatus Dormibacteraeota bacterium]
MTDHVDRTSDREKGKQPTHWSELLRPAEVLIWLLIAVAVVELYTRASFLVTHIFSVLLLFVFAGIIALLLTPVVDAMETVVIFRKRRGLAAIALLVLLLAVITAIVALVMPSMVAQAKALPALVIQSQKFLTNLQDQLKSHGIPLQVQLPTGSSNGAVIGSAIGILGGTLTTVIDILLVTVISIYLLAQGRQLIAAARNIFPGHQEVFDFILLAVGTTMAGYARGQLIMSVGMGLYTGIGMSLVGVHYAIVLGVLTFFLEFIPLVGAPLGMAAAVVVALFQSPVTALLAAIVGVGGHALEAYIIGPRVSGHATRLHPLAAMGALLIGAELGGVLGALFAIPVAAMANVFLGAIYRKGRGEDALTTSHDGEVHSAALPRLGEEIGDVKQEGPLEGEVPHTTGNS